MLLFGALRLAADRCGSKLGRRPDGSFLARPPTHNVGQKLTFAKDRCPAVAPADDDWSSAASGQSSTMPKSGMQMAFVASVPMVRALCRTPAVAIESADCLRGIPCCLGRAHARHETGQ
jgi:hypothetical protein